MAAAKKKPAKAVKKNGNDKAGASSGKRGGKAGFIAVMIILGFATPFIFPTIVLCIIGLLPTIVAFCVDRDREHSSATAIGAMNCAGLTPFVIDLWIRGQTMGNAFHILGDANSWLIILGASAIGQMIVAVVPQALATLTLAHCELRIKTLKQNLEQLKNSWGPDVGTTKPLDKLARME
jgi:hypothetical protein